jgi:hypothetical protein
MEQDIAVTTKKSNRIVALDIIRGYFLLVIMVNHIEMYPNVFDLGTGRGRLLVSAAEGFFFMSGLLVGMVYKRRLSLGMKFIFKKMWRRALELYAGSIILTVLFTAAAAYLHHPTIKDGIGDVSNWPHILYETSLMRYGFGWGDFLDRFAILMLMAPFSFYLLTKKKWWLLLIISTSAWAIRGNNFTLSWQIIFNLAMIIGYHWDAINKRLRDLSAKTQRAIKWSVVSITLVTFALSYASVYILSLLNQRLTNLPQSWQNFTLEWNKINEFVWLYSQKWTMGPVRIVLFLIWFSALFMWVNRHYVKINRYTRHIFELLGSNSLFVYIAHAFLVFTFKLFIAPGKPLYINFIVTLAAVISLVMVTILYKRYQQLTKTDKSPRQKNRTVLKSKNAES